MKKLWIKVKLLFNGVISKIMNYIIENDKLVKEIAPIAVNVCNFIKEYNDSDATNIIESIIASSSTLGASSITLVNKWFADKNMDVIISFFGILEKVADKTTAVDKLTAISNYIKSLDSSAKAKAWTDLATLIAHSLSDGKLEFNEIKTIVSLIYETKANL